MRDTEVYFTINLQPANAGFYEMVDSAFAKIGYFPWIGWPEGEPAPAPSALIGLRDLDGYRPEFIPWDQRAERHDFVEKISSKYSPTEEGGPRIFDFEARYANPETIAKVALTSNIANSLFSEMSERDAILRFQAVAWELHHALASSHTRCLWKDTKAGLTPDILRFEFTPERNIFLSAHFDWAAGKDPDTWEIPPFVLFPEEE